MSESARGCGYRRIGGLYLVSDSGPAIDCDGLPLPIVTCDCCGFKPPFSRNLQRIQPQYIIQAETKLHERRVKEIAKANSQVDLSCKCPQLCPICYPPNDELMGLMYVGKEYTPSSFISEAVKMGISKRIPEIPSWLTLGKTWVFLAHKHVPKVSLDKLKQNGLYDKEPETELAIFYGFKPQRIEMPVWKGELTNEEIILLKDHGITPIPLDPTPANKKLHKASKTNIKELLRKLKEKEEEEPE